MMFTNLFFLIVLASVITIGDSFAPRLFYHSSKSTEDEMEIVSSSSTFMNGGITATAARKIPNLYSTSPRSSSSSSSQDEESKQQMKANRLHSQQEGVMNFFRNNIFQQPLSSSTTNPASAQSSKESSMNPNSIHNTNDATSTLTAPIAPTTNQQEQEHPNMTLMDNAPGLSNTSKTYTKTTSETCSSYNTQSESSVYTNTIYHKHDHFHQHNHDHRANKKKDKNTTSDDNAHVVVSNHDNAKNDPPPSTPQKQHERQGIIQWSEEVSASPSTYPEQQQEQDQLPTKSSEQILLEQTLEHQAYTYGPTNIETMKTLHNLATYMYTHSIHEKEDSKKLLNICHQQQLAVLGCLHDDTISSMNNLARIYVNDGEYEFARDLIMNSEYLDVIRSSRSDDSNNNGSSSSGRTSMSSSASGNTSYEKGGIIQPTPQIIEKPPYKSPPSTPTTTTNPSKSNNNNNNNENYIQTLPRLDERILDTLVQLAFAYHREGIVDESIELYETYLSHYDDYGHNDDDDNNDDGGDDDYHERRRRKQKYILKHNNLKTSAQQNLAILHQTQGHYDKAIPLIQESYTSRQILLGIDHPLTLGSMNNLAALYHKIGNYEKAWRLYKDCLDLKKESLGMDHPDTLLTLRNMDRLKEMMG